MSRWDLSQFDGKDVIFIGAGKGRAMSGIKSFLETHARLASFSGVDKQSGDSPLEFLKTYDQEKTIFIKNEGIPGREVPVPYLTQLQLFFELVTATGARTIGITGTKGKSTTSSLTAHILKTAGKTVILAGNIGLSPFEALDTATGDTIFVIELSSYQLSDLTTSPHISACINLYNDHTDWHGSLEEYWEAKHAIMRYAGKNDIFVYDPTFPALQAWAAEAACRTIAIDTSEALSLEHSSLFGEHNRTNALIARTIARQLDIPDDTTQTAIDSFQPLEHRMEFVATRQGRLFVNDAIGMTPESTTASMRAVEQKFGAIGCIMLGGQDRGYDFTALVAEISRQKIPALVLFPDTGEAIKAGLPAGYQPQMLETADMATAVRWAATQAPDGSVVLLSTGAPSYSVWSDFEEKGRLFKQAVHQLE